MYPINADRNADANRDSDEYAVRYTDPLTDTDGDHDALRRDAAAGDATAPDGQLCVG